MRKYRAESNEDDIISGNSSSIAATPVPQFMQHMMDYEQSEEDISFTEETIDEEFNSYVTSVPKPTVKSGKRTVAFLDPLKFWEVSIYNCHGDQYIRVADIYTKTNRLTFPTLYKIALDYLPIQASSVPCERVFSSSAETDTKKRNRISSELMEALQLLKFGYKKDRLNFTGDLLADREDLTGESPELVGRDPLAERLKKGKARADDDDQEKFIWDDDIE